MDLGATISKICLLFNEIAQAKGTSITVTIDRSCPKRVLCDRNRLTQVLNNLVNSACKFTDKGRITIRVTGEKLTGDTVRVYFSERIPASGSPNNHLEEIFLPFKQIEISDHRAFGGTGLGLAIVARLVKLMGGKIRVKSQLGVGTTFSFPIRTDSDASMSAWMIVLASHTGSII